MQLLNLVCIFSSLKDQQLFAMPLKRLTEAIRVNHKKSWKGVEIILGTFSCNFF